MQDEGGSTTLLSVACSMQNTLMYPFFFRCVKMLHIRKCRDVLGIFDAIRTTRMLSMMIRKKGRHDVHDMADPCPGTTRNMLYHHDDNILDVSVSVE